MNLVIKRNITPRLLGAFVCLLLLFGCKKDKAPFENVLLLGSDFMEVSSAAGSHTFELLTNVDYSLSSDADWLSFEAEAGTKGKQKIAFKVTKNEEEERTAVIKVSINAEQEREIMVVQEAGSINVFYVKKDAKGTGRSWADAIGLQAALDLSTSGSELHIAAGTYSPEKALTGAGTADEADRTFEISKNIKLVGGYPADAAVGAVANPAAHPTILSGKLASGLEVFHVMAITAPKAADQQVEIQGITIRDGNGTDRSTKILVGGVGYSRGNGAGMIIGGAKVILTDVSIIENKTSTRQGTGGYASGLFAFGGTELYMYNSHIDNNTGIGNGGGLWIDASNAYLYDSSFDNNKTVGTAGAIHAYPASNLYMYNCTVRGNQGTSYGAGVYLREKSTGYIVNCIISNNKTTSTNGGGGLMLYDNCEAHVISSTIVGNEATGPGAGIFRRQNTNKLSIINSIVSGNKQAATSTDVDAYEAGAVAAQMSSSAIATRVYNAGGSVQSGVTFNAATMLNTAFVPTGASNPALKYGMSGAALSSLGLQYKPALDELIAKDFNRKDRGEKTTMGALID